MVKERDRRSYRILIVLSYATAASIGHLKRRPLFAVQDGVEWSGVNGRDGRTAAERIHGLTTVPSVWHTRLASVNILGTDSDVAPFVPEKLFRDKSLSRDLSRNNVFQHSCIDSSHKMAF